MSRGDHYSVSKALTFQEAVIYFDFDEELQTRRITRNTIRHCAQCGKKLARDNREKICKNHFIRREKYLPPPGPYQTTPPIVIDAFTRFIEHPFKNLYGVGAQKQEHVRDRSVLFFLLRNDCRLTYLEVSASFGEVLSKNTIALALKRVEKNLGGEYKKRIVAIRKKYRKISAS